MTALLIRPATLADVAVLCQLGATTFRETYRPLSDPREVDEYADEHFTADKVAAWFTQPCARTLLAHVGDAAVGYAHVRSAKVPACVGDRKAVELSRLYLLAVGAGRRRRRRADRRGASPRPRALGGQDGLAGRLRPQREGAGVLRPPRLRAGGHARVRVRRARSMPIRC